jgi:hypothetical protein
MIKKYTEDLIIGIGHEVANKDAKDMKTLLNPRMI